MAKTGRNDPCPCGSGKKYKRCHGAIAPTPVLRGDAMLDPKATSTKITFMGLPAQPEHLHIVNRFKGDDPRNAAPLQGTEGDYKVTFILRRPGFSLHPENSYSFATGLRGDSHLAITKPAFTPPGNPDADQILISGITEDGTFQFTGFPNERGFLGKLESAPFRARDRADAEKKAYRALASSLSNWSIHLDIPMEVYQIDTAEMTTGNTQMSLTTPYWEAPFSVMPTAEMKAEFRGYASLYREALSSSSAVYRFLCFYKIVEGILSRRTRLAQEAKDAARPITRHREYLPRTPDEIVTWLNASFPVRRAWDVMAVESAVPPEIRGRKFGHVINTILQPLRVDIAHALSSKSGELTMSVDELLHIEKINKWMLPAKCLARRMLKNEFPAEFLPYLREDGTIVP